jgi:hypothetical protein
MATTTNKAWQKDDDTTAIDQDAFINAFLDDLDSSLFGIGANSAKPGSPDEGDTFYDTDASRFIKYNGSTWVQVMPDAANVIDSDHYVDGSIDSVHLAADVVTGAKIADDAIDSEHYTDGSIDTVHLAADAVTAAKIGDDVIDSEHYADGSIDNAHIADDAIDSEHYADGSIDNAHIADDAIDSEHYADGSIDSAHLADDAVTLAKTAAGTQGGILYYASGGAPTELPASTSGYVLKTQGAAANPVWAAAAAGGPSQADQAALEGETDENTYAPPDLIKHSPGVAKFWVSFDNSGAIQDSYNTTSVADDGTGDFTVTIGTDFSNADWVYQMNCDIGSAWARFANSDERAEGTINCETKDQYANFADPGGDVQVAGWGEQ